MILIAIITLAMLATAATIAAERAVKGDEAVGKMAIDKLADEMGRTVRLGLGWAGGAAVLGLGLIILVSALRFAAFLLGLLF